MRVRSRSGFYGVLALVVIATAAAAPAASPSGAEEPSVSLAAAAPSHQRPVNARALRGGVLATFDVHGETFRVWTTNATAIEQLYALREGRSTATIPIGRILLGPGRGAHNAPWRWHLDHESFGLADFTIELCDAMPSYVQQNLLYFVLVVRAYCPWGAVLVDLRDFR